MNPFYCVSSRWLELKYQPTLHSATCWLPVGYLLATGCLPVGFLLRTCWLPVAYLLATCWLPVGYLLATWSSNFDYTINYLTERIHLRDTVSKQIYQTKDTRTATYRYLLLFIYKLFSEQVRDFNFVFYYNLLQIIITHYQS